MGRDFLGGFFGINSFAKKLKEDKDKIGRHQLGKLTACKLEAEDKLSRP